VLGVVGRAGVEEVDGGGDVVLVVLERLFAGFADGFPGLVGRE
jgi:hypothetical protein